MSMICTKNIANICKHMANEIEGDVLAVMDSRKNVKYPRPMLFHSSMN